MVEPEHPGPLPEGDPPELLDRAAAGDAAALEELFQKYLPALRAFLRLRMSPALGELADALERS